MPHFDAEPLTERLVFSAPETLHPTLPRLLLGMADPGSFNSVWPVYNELVPKANLWIAAADFAARQLEKEKMKPVAMEAYRKIVENVRPQALLVGCSHRPGIERSLTRQARQFSQAHGHELPVVFMIDMFADILQRSYLRQPHGQDVSPDGVCVADEATQQQCLRLRPDLSSDEVWVTGQPAFDRLLPLLQHKDQLRHHLREKYRIGDQEKVILFAGQLTGTAAALTTFFQTLATFDSTNIVLIIRPHPRDPTPVSEYERLWQTFSGRRIETSAETTEELLPLTDLVVSMFSTINSAAAYLQIPTLYLQSTPLCRQSFLFENPSGFLSLVELGGAALSLSKEQEEEIVPRLLSDSSRIESMRQAQRKHLLLDGKSAERVGEKVLGLLGKVKVGPSRGRQL